MSPWFLLFLLFLLAAPSFAADDDECTLYMAPSTIPNAGTGIFTAQPIKQGQSIGIGDIIVPLLDIRWHNRVDPESPFRWPLDDYVWDGIKTMGMHRETIPVVSGGIVDAYAPGLDAAINCHLALLNVDRSQAHYDFTMIDHSNNSPAVGAMSPYWNSTTIASHTIPAGGELFKFYGDLWFKTRPQFARVPLSTDYPRIERMLHMFRAVVMNKETNSLRLQQAVYRFVQIFRPLWRPLNALPKTWDDLLYTLQHDIRSLHQKSALHDNLHEMDNARCLDNIQPKKSTLPHAGRGAFATRSLRKGQVITGSPLIHMVHREVLRMHETKEIRIEEEEDDDDDSDNDDEEHDDNTPPKEPKVMAVPDFDQDPIGQQIILNYCWGHAESTMLLCPYGTGVNFINHHSHDSNVAIRWAPNGHLGQNETWLDLSVDDLTEHNKPNLAWDFVALRDIEKGEELFIDYGTEWQEAWDQHVKDWNNTKEVWTDYKPAAQLSAELRDQPLRTSQEEPYPANVEVVCHETILPSSHENPRKYNSEELWPINCDGIRCEILDRIDGTDDEVLYRVGVSTVNDSDEDEYTEVDNVLRRQISFRDKHMSTGLHSRGVFRHDARIPDGMFPAAWRNLNDEHGSVIDESRDEL